MEFGPLEIPHADGRGTRAPRCGCDPWTKGSQHVGLLATVSTVQERYQTVRPVSGHCNSQQACGRTLPPPNTPVVSQHLHASLHRTSMPFSSTPSQHVTVAPWKRNSHLFVRGRRRGRYLEDGNAEFEEDRGHHRVRFHASQVSPPAPHAPSTSCLRCPKPEQPAFDMTTHGTYLQPIPPSPEASHMPLRLMILPADFCRLHRAQGWCSCRQPLVHAGHALI